MKKPQLVVTMLSALAAGTMFGMILSAPAATAVTAQNPPPQDPPQKAPPHSAAFPPLNNQPPASGGGGGGAGAGGAGADDFNPEDMGDKITLEQAPQKVQDAVRQIVGGNTLHGIYKDADDDYEMYIVGWVNAASSLPNYATLGPGGEFIQWRSGITKDRLPLIVADRIAKKHPKAVIKNAFQIQEASYEITLVIDGKERHAMADASGEIDVMDADMPDDGDDMRGGKRDIGDN